ncbi:MAG: (d)CMP kinase [Alloprevotella sp.]|nr:(d)CMP kinase [Alloprevotella sp.]
MKKIVVAIDGHSSCGKSTMAKALARKVGYIYVDTGAMYRAVTLYALRGGMAGGGKVDAEALRSRMDGAEVSFRLGADGVPVVQLNGADVEREIRTMEVSYHVRLVAALPFVREALTRQQQRMGQEKGIVMDGRDIGTAVFPEAELKVFVTASDEVRARRRYNELLAKGQQADLEQVLANVRERDYIDSHREIAPLRQAPDALVLDNSAMTIAEQDAWLLEAFYKAADR